MTDKPTPADAELEALLLDKLPASKHYIRPVIEKMVAAMQAAIDKWGQPAQARADSVQEDAAPPTAQAEGWTKTEPMIARSRGEWHEDDGPVVWWSWDGHGWAGEPPWCGTPLDSDWPGYHTHWTPAPPAPTSAEGVDHG